MSINVILEKSNKNSKISYEFCYDQRKRIAPNGCPDNFTQRLPLKAFPIKITIELISGVGRCMSGGGSIYDFWRGGKPKIIGIEITDIYRLKNGKTQAAKGIRFTRKGISINYSH